MRALLNPAPVTLICKTVMLGPPVPEAFVMVRLLVLVLPTGTFPKAKVELPNCKLARTAPDDPFWALPHPQSARLAPMARTRTTGDRERNQIRDLTVSHYPQHLADSLESGKP